MCVRRYERLTCFSASRNGLREINTVAKALRNQEFAYDIVLGTWQAEHGFMRPWSEFELMEPRWLWGPITQVNLLYKVIKADLRKLLWKIGIRV